MVRGRREGVVIAGGGIAGCLAALALARFRPEVPLLIVEEKPKFGGDRLRTLFAAEVEDDARSLLAPLVTVHWPGYYVAFPGQSRKLKAELGAIAPGAVHKAMLAALRPDQYRLGTRVVAVKEDALVLDGGEELKAEGAIDARGAANLSMLDLLWEVRLERDYRLTAPHGLDRPVLVDATAESANGLNYMQVVPLAPDRLLVADVAIGEPSQPDAQAGQRLENYVAMRGWKTAKAGPERAAARPLPAGGDFDAFWRIGGARAARLGLRGGFLHPASGRTIADAARMAVRLSQAEDFSGAALHDAFEEESKRLWRQREPLRAVIAALAAAEPAERRAIFARLHALDGATIAHFHADQMGMMDRRRIAKALKG